MFDFFNLQTAVQHPTAITVFYTFLLAFALSSMLAFTYEKTFKGLSYSRNFVQALVLSSIVAATVIQAIGDSVAIGLGMIGALSIIRFRTSLRDPRDIIFIFAGLAAGISCGVRGYNIAVLGTVGFCLVAFMLHYSPFGHTSFFDGMLRFNMANDTESKVQLETVLNEYCKIFVLITLRDLAQGKRLDYAYHIKLRDEKDKTRFVETLQGIETIKGINLMLQETTVEL